MGRDELGFGHTLKRSREVYPCYYIGSCLHPSHDVYNIYIYMCVWHVCAFLYMCVRAFVLLPLCIIIYS